MSKDILFPSAWYRELLDGPCSSWKSDPDRISTVKEAIDQLRLQQGVVLGVLQLAGVKFEELTRMPARWRRDDAAKYLRWADQLQAMGYDGESVREAIRCKLNPVQD
jgi:hypothetical protein